MKRRWTIRVLAVVCILAVLAASALGASKERFVVLWPDSPNKSTTGVLTDSTSALCSATAGNWVDLSSPSLQCAKIMIGATWTKSDDIDTVDFLLRATDGTKTTVINIDTDLGKVASSAYQQMYAFADSSDLAGMKYVQLVARIGVIDNTDAARLQNFDVAVGTYDGLGNTINRFLYLKKVRGLINE